jgi:hypothetical protein
MEKTMPKQIIKPLFFMILVSCASSIEVSANSISNIIALNSSADISYGDNFSLSRSSAISTKRGEKYDAAKDPALRRGTENWEEPQGSYFAIPALVIGVIGIVLFFNRE